MSRLRELYLRRDQGTPKDWSETSSVDTESRDGGPGFGRETSRLGVPLLVLLVLAEVRVVDVRLDTGTCDTVVDTLPAVVVGHVGPAGTRARVQTEGVDTQGKDESTKGRPGPPIYRSLGPDGT